MCPINFYTSISHSIATSALARANRPSILRISTNIGTKLHQPRELAEYVSVPCMDIGHRSLVVANAWVRGKSTSNPKVNLDFNGDFGYRIFGNPHAQTWLSDAIEASLFGNFHPALLINTTIKE